MLVTILLFKIKVVLCVITRHHHRHRFEKKIIRSEREVNAEIESFSFDDGGRRPRSSLEKTNTHLSSSRCRKNTRQRGHKRETKRERKHFSYLQHGLEPVRHSSRHYYACVSSVLQRRSKSSLMLSRVK